MYICIYVGEQIRANFGTEVASRVPQADFYFRSKSRSIQLPKPKLLEILLGEHCEMTSSKWPPDIDNFCKMSSI